MLFNFICISLNLICLKNLLSSLLLYFMRVSRNIMCYVLLKPWYQWYNYKFVLRKKSFFIITLRYLLINTYSNTPTHFIISFNYTTELRLHYIMTNLILGKVKKYLQALKYFFQVFIFLLK